MHEAADLDCTVVVGIDQGTIKQFKETWRTWYLMRPFLFDWPWLIFYEPDNDKRISRDDIVELHETLPIKDVQFVAWAKSTYHTQREKMVTGHLFVPAKLVETKWFLKIDTDSVAHSNVPAWPKPEWFAPDDNGEDNAFVGSTWGYTRAKGGGPLNDDLVAWCEALEVFGDRAFGTPRLGIGDRITSWDHPKGPRMKWKRGRLASWICFQNTAWVQEMAALFSGLYGEATLPVPSHDTCLWYAALRCNKRFTLSKMQRHGWLNRMTLKSIRSEVGKVLAEQGT